MTGTVHLQVFNELSWHFLSSRLNQLAVVEEFVQVHVLEKTNKFSSAASASLSPYFVACTWKSGAFPAAVGHVPSKPHVPMALLMPCCHLPGLLSVFHNTPIPCSAPGSQLTSILSTKLPAVLKFSCSCTTLSPSPQPTLAWRKRNPPNSCNSQKLHHQPPAAHLGQTLLPTTLPPPPRLDLITGLFNSEKHLEV